MRMIVIWLLSSCCIIAQTQQSTWSRHRRLNPMGNLEHPSAFAERNCAVDHFQLLCALPYDGRARPIDSSCGHCGQSALTGDKLTAEFSQNFAKNNLCASSETVTPVTVDDFKRLQLFVDQLRDFPYGNPHAGGFGPPLDRSPLQSAPLVNGKQLKEGLVVQYVGFMIEEHYSPSSSSSSGESVNCNDTDQPSVDIHIALGDRQERLSKHANEDEKNSKLCPTITAEMIPHYRPDDWEYSQLESISDRRVRVVGQLFFDGSHRPCDDPHRATTDPKRISSWEIHPIYAIDVCKRGSGCDPQTNSDWESVREATRGEDEE
jgi:hypothetical protein